MYGRDHRKVIGERIQSIRGSRDQRTFAENVDSVQQTISKYERGEVPRSWLFLARLAEEENVDLNRLLTGKPSTSDGAPTNGGRGEGRTRRNRESAYETAETGDNGGRVRV